MKNIIFAIILVLYPSVKAVEYFFDLSGGNSTGLTNDCGGLMYRNGSWTFQDATSYGYTSGTVYTSTLSACISPQIELQFTRNSSVHIEGFANYQTWSEGIMLFVINSETSEMYQFLFAYFPFPIALNNTFYLDALAPDWVFNGTHNLAITSYTPFTNTGKLSLRNFKLDSP